MIDYINSINNKQIKHILNIKNNKKYRNENKLCFLEGLRLINDTPKEYLETIYIDENFDKQLLTHKNIPLFYISNQVLNKIKTTKNSQGIVALAKFNDINNIDFFIDKNNIFCLDFIQDPGNMGTIFRSLEASGIKNIILSSDSCDIYNEKVIRSSMSSIFRINHYISNDIINDILYLKRNGFNIIGTSAKAKQNYYEIDINEKNIIIIGNEANGIRKQIDSICDYNIKIDIEKDIESLNAAIALSIISFEIRKKYKNEFYIIK